VKILSKYVLKEHLGPLAFALTALTSLLLLNYIAKQFGQLVGKGLPWTVIGEFFVLSVPFTVAMTLPMAVLVSTLYAFSRLAAENEITAMKASGVSLAKVMIPVAAGATFLAVLMVGFNDQILPRANHELSQLQGDIARKKPTFALREQVINEVSPGKLFLKTSRLDESSNRMRDVVIYDMQDPQRGRTIIADSGNMAMTRDQRDLILTLYDGYMQEIPRATPDQLQRLFYRVDFIRVKGVGNTLERSETNYKSDREMSVCEMQKEVEGTEREKMLVRGQLAHILVNGVREVTSDAPLIPEKNEKAGPPSRSLARYYCTALDRLSGVKPPPTVADTAVTAATPTVTVPQETERQIVVDAIKDVAHQPKPVDVHSGPPPSEFFRGQRQLAEVSVNPGMIEAMRSRLDDRTRSMSALEVEIQKKFALAVACIVFVLLGAPIALRFPRGGVGLVIGVSFTVFAAYYVCLIAGESLADRDILSPFWAMWGANIIFGAVGLLLLVRMGRESSTSRGGDMSELLDTTRAWFARQVRRVGVDMDRRRRIA
jgi:lipopolysaccharide export system permease protein